MEEVPQTQRPPYTKVDFSALSKKDESFNKLWQTSKNNLNFKDPSTCQTLTQALLRTDFNLTLSLPPNRLCPPIPNRWNYVSWLQSLIDSTSPTYNPQYDPEREITGLDIGTGASAIYTLLILRTRPKWKMCVTDVDKCSFESAARNLALNGLLARTKMLLTVEAHGVIPLRYLGVEKLDFTICNPPFFTDESEMQASLNGEGKSGAPNAVCTGSENEMVFPGGDLGFVKEIVRESLVLREKVRWYSSMLGKLSSAKAIIQLLKDNGIANWAVGCLEPGGMTKRWVVAWSFGDLRPRNDIARIDTIAHEYLPFPTLFKIPLPADIPTTTAIEITTSQLSSLDLRWKWDPESATGIGEAAQNVWNRAYRREQQRKKKAGEVEMQGDEEDMKVALAFRIRVVEWPEKEVVIDWLRGVDVLLWESFCGMLHRCFRKS